MEVIPLSHYKNEPAHFGLYPDEPAQIKLFIPYFLAGIRHILPSIIDAYISPLPSTVKLLNAE